MINIAYIRKIARQKGVNSWKLKKVELIKRIQRAEGYDDCFSAPRVLTCDRDDCLWREDCERSLPS